VLNFVYDNQALQVGQGADWIGQSLARDGVFQVEVTGAGHVNELTGQCCLAYLPRTDQFDCAKGLKQRSELVCKPMAVDEHATIVSNAMKIENTIFDFHGV